MHACPCFALQLPVPSQVPAQWPLGSSLPFTVTQTRLAQPWQFPGQSLSRVQPVPSGPSGATSDPTSGKGRSARVSAPKPSICMGMSVGRSACSTRSSFPSPLFVSDPRSATSACTAGVSCPSARSGAARALSSVALSGKNPIACVADDTGTIWAFERN